MGKKYKGVDIIANKERALTAVELTALLVANTGVSAITTEYKDKFKTVLTLTAVTLATITAVAKSRGYELGTFKSTGTFSNFKTKSALTYKSAGAETCTPIIGIGTGLAASNTIGTLVDITSVTTLHTTAILYDLSGDIVNTIFNGTTPVVGTTMYGAGGVVVARAGAQTINLNFAGTWSGTNDITITGTITLVYDYEA